MKSSFNKTPSSYLLLASSLLLCSLQTAHAVSTFSDTSSLTIGIHSINNLTNSGNLSGLNISRLFEEDTLSTGAVITGNASASSSYSVDPLPGNLTSGDSFNQLFNASGIAIDGSADAFYAAYGFLELNNSSATDTFEIQLSVEYAIGASANNAYANSNVSLDLYDDLGFLSDFFHVNTLNADPNSINNTGNPLIYTISLTPGELDNFYADISINSYAQASTVPIPAAFWFFSTGIMAFGSMRKFRKQKQAD